MRKVELDESFYQYCEVYGDFTLKEISSPDIFKAFYMIFSVIGDHSQYADVILELLKLATPTCDDIPWLLRHKSEHLTRLHLLKANMDKSVVFTKQAKQEQEVTTRAAKLVPSLSTPKAGAKHKAKRQRKVKAAKPKRRDPSIQALVNGERSPYYHEDLHHALSYVCGRAKAELLKEKQHEVQRMLRTGLLFGLKQKHEKLKSNSLSRASLKSSIFTRSSGTDCKAIWQNCLK